MPTDKVQMVGEVELQRLKDAEKKLAQLEKAQFEKVVDVPGGRITVGKRWDASKGEKGEYVTAAYANITIWKKDQYGNPVENGKKWTDKSGVEHPNYEIYTVVRLPESVALKVFSGEAKAGTLWHTPLKPHR